jgi:hypothetical protein
MFAAHAQDYQIVAGHAAAFHQQFMQNLTAGAGAYASAETANAAVLRPLNAIAGSVANAAAPINPLTPLTEWYDAVMSQLQNAIGGLLFFLLSPILTPIIDAIAKALVDAFIQALLGQSSTT